VRKVKPELAKSKFPAAQALTHHPMPVVMPPEYLPFWIGQEKFSPMGDQ